MGNEGKKAGKVSVTQHTHIGISGAFNDFENISCVDVFSYLGYRTNLKQFFSKLWNFLRTNSHKLNRTVDEMQYTVNLFKQYQSWMIINDFSNANNVSARCAVTEAIPWNEIELGYFDALTLHDSCRNSDVENWVCFNDIWILKTVILDCTEVYCCFFGWCFQENKLN